MKSWTLNVKWRYWIALPDFIYGNKLTTLLYAPPWKMGEDLTSQILSQTKISAQRNRVMAFQYCESDLTVRFVCCNDNIVA